MPRYFFHVQDGVSLHDSEGTELADLTTARRQAIELAGRIIAEEAKRRDLGEDWSMDVTDENGLILFKIDFHVAESPAVRSDRLKKEQPS